MAYTLASESLEFRDGTSLTVQEATWLEDTRLAELEEAAKAINAKEQQAAETENSELSDIERKIQFFRLNVYPKMAGCAHGEVPSEEAARQMPATELNRWYSAARRVNPDWFTVFDALAAQAKDEKKRELRPVK